MTPDQSFPSLRPPTPKELDQRLRALQGTLGAAYPTKAAACAAAYNAPPMNVTVLSDETRGGNTVLYVWDGTRFLYVSTLAPEPALPAPPVPVAIGATVTDSRVDLSWAISSSILTGQLLVRTNADGSTTNLPITASAVRYSDTGLPARTRFVYTLTQVNATGTAVSGVTATTSAPAVVVVPPAPPVPALPPAPTAFTVVAGNGTNVLGWVNPGGLTGITLTENGVPVSVAANATGITRSGLTNGTAYVYVLAFQNAGGTGPAATASGTPVTSTPATNPYLPMLDDPTQPVPAAALTGNPYLAMLSDPTQPVPAAALTGNPYLAVL